MSAVLASVRTLAEARVVAACGVPWIDLKEPAEGALGAVSPAIIAAVVGEFGANHVISATIGDCWERPWEIARRVATVAASGAHYAKVGLHAQALSAELFAALGDAVGQGIAVIAVCFAESPPVRQDLEQLAALGLRGVMLDTAEKGGPGLIHRLSAEQLAAFVATAGSLGVLCGLAGKLALDDVDVLLPLGADYLGFRSALCVAGDRIAALDEAAVRRTVAKCRATVPRDMAHHPSLDEHPGEHP